MKNLVNYAEVKEAGASNPLVAGGYVCKYTKVEDNTDKEYLRMEFDIAEGEFKDYYKDLEERANFWGGTVYRSYKENAIPMFKRMCSSVAKSNPSYEFNPFVQGGNSNEQTLVGKLIGIVLKEEEYQKNDGNIGTRLVVAYECDAQKIRSGNFKIPQKKVLENKSEDNSWVNVPQGEEENPFN